MRRLPTIALLAGALTAAALNTGPAAAVGAQEVVAGEAVPRVVSKVVSLGPDRARLLVDFESGAPLDLSLTDGEVRIGSRTLGSYSPGGALDEAWRSLISSTLSLEDNALLDRLVEWEPPAGLGDGEREVAERMDQALEEQFDSAATRALTVEREARDRALKESLGGLSNLAILSRIDALAGLSAAIDELDDAELQVVVDDHLEIPAGTTWSGSLLVVDGSLELRGAVDGDILVVDGEIEMHPGSRITGNLSLSESDLDDDGGEVSGRVIQLRRDTGSLESEIRESIRRELRDEFRGESRAPDVFRPFRRVIGGIGDVLGELLKVMILGGIGLLFFNFAGPNMDTVSDVARSSTGRAALVGLAGGALIVPIWILGIVGLALTIIGIPAILIWVPLFPAAVALAALMGYLAVARNVGAWLSRQGYAWADWVQVTRPGTLLFGGLLVFAGPFIAAEVLEIVGFLDFFAVLLKISGTVMILFAAAVGLGAVLLSRGGRRPEDWGADLFSRPFAGMNWGRDWEAEAFDAEVGDHPEAQEAKGDDADHPHDAPRGPGGEGDAQGEAPVGEDGHHDDGHDGDDGQDGRDRDHHRGEHGEHDDVQR